MKSKGFTYILILAVGIIWYKVFVRVVSNFEDVPIELSQNANLTNVNLSVHRDTFKLNADYADPFRIGHQSVVSQNFNSENTTPKIVRPRIEKPMIFWPKIKYKGLVKRTNSNDPLALILIDNNPLHMRKGEVVFDGIQLKSIYRDSVLIIYNKEKKVFRRE